MNKPRPARFEAPPTETSARPLNTVQAGLTCRIVAIRGGRHVTQRLTAMGLMPGRDVQVLRNWGPVIVRMQQNRLALGRGAAGHVLVSAGAGSPA